MNASNEYVLARESSKNINQYNFTKFNPKSDKNERGQSISNKINYYPNPKPRPDSTNQRANNLKYSTETVTNPYLKEKNYPQSPNLTQTIPTEKDSFEELNKVNDPNAMG